MDQVLNTTSVNIILYDPDMYFFYLVVRQSTPGLPFVFSECVCCTFACRSSAWLHILWQEFLLLGISFFIASLFLSYETFQTYKIFKSNIIISYRLKNQSIKNTLVFLRVCCKRLIDKTKEQKLKVNLMVKAIVVKSI